MFSPYYAWRGRRDPDDHVAVNVALYGRRRRWTMTERGRDSLGRNEMSLTVGSSWFAWDGTALVIHLDEVAVPVPRRVLGLIRIEPRPMPAVGFVLDEAGRHHWRPIAPRARIEVEMRDPALHWTGTAYLDANHGSEPLEAGFRSWQWSRAHTPEGTVIVYETDPRQGPPFARCLRIADDGSVDDMPMPPPRALPTTPWGIRRSTRIPLDAAADVVHTLEDSPFYARSLLHLSWKGRKVAAVHESLDLDRFARQWVRLLLPFRMPRRP